MVALVWALTPVVSIVKEAVVCPAATFTEVGTVALELLDTRGIDTPVLGASPVKVTVPVEDEPP